MNNQIPVASDYIKNFEQLGFGMFVHFGLYSKLNAGEWTYFIHKRNMDEYAKLVYEFDVRKDSMANLVAVAKKPAVNT